MVAKGKRYGPYVRQQQMQIENFDDVLAELRSKLIQQSPLASIEIKEILADRAVAAQNKCCNLKVAQSQSKNGRFSTLFTEHSGTGVRC